MSIGRNWTVFLLIQTLINMFLVEFVKALNKSIIFADLF